MKPKSSYKPVTKVKNQNTEAFQCQIRKFIFPVYWIIMGKVFGLIAWADRITFEEIRKVTGLTEGQVIDRMRKSLRPSSFRLWRKRASTKSIKHQKLFKYRRKNDQAYRAG